MDPKELAAKIANYTSEEMQTKFMKGQDEHGGDFAKKPTVRNVREEVLDLIHYSFTLKEHQDELVALLEKFKARLSDPKPMAYSDMFDYIELAIKQAKEL